MKNKIKRIIICILFLIFVVPSVLSADSQNPKKDVSCIAGIYSRDKPLPNRLFEPMAWKQQASIIFVGEVVWAEPRKEADFPCGIAVGSRKVRSRVTEILMGDVKPGMEIDLIHDWCEFFEEKYSTDAKLIISLIPHYYSYKEDTSKKLYSFIPRAGRSWKGSKVAWELPLNPENREKTKTFIQCIQDLGLVKKMLEEDKK